jgi:sulfur relay (sulfurtransferase) DsrC/TusE family protein
MATSKRREKSLKIPDFFGTYNTYRIFALQSDFSVFPFANQLGKALQTSFTIVPDFEFVSNKFAAQFTVFYAEYSQEESIHFLLLENKTVKFNQQDNFVSKTEKKLPFQTLSLFEEWLYLFNDQGLRCFELEFANMDYLLLLFAKKDIENDVFSQFLQNITPFKARDVSYLIEKEQTAAEAKIVSFLRDFYCKHEVKAFRFSRKRRMELLAPVKQIPKQNFQFPIPILLENNSIADHLQLSERNLGILRGEV